MKAFSHLQMMPCGEFALLFDSASGRISVLNRIGVDILELLQAGAQELEISRTLSNRYAISEEIAGRDVLDFLGQLRRNKMISRG